MQCIHLCVAYIIAVSFSIVKSRYSCYNKNLGQKATELFAWCIAGPISNSDVLHSGVKLSEDFMSVEAEKILISTGRLTAYVKAFQF